MSLVQAVQKLSQLHNNKKLNINQIANVLEEVYKQKDKIILSQKVSILAAILNLIFVATKNYIQQISKFRHEICFDPLKSITQKKNRNISTMKKNRSRLVYKKDNNLTIDQILAQAVRQGMSQVDSSMDLITPKRQPIMPQIKATTIPPFQPNLIAQLSQDESAIINLPQKTHNRNVSEQKMMTYLKLLHMNEQQVDILSIKPKLDRTVDNTNKKTVKKRQTIKHDNQIQLQQEFDKIQHLQRLSTKIRLGRQQQKLPLNIFQKKIQNCNPKLTNTNQIIQRLILNTYNRQYHKNNQQILMEVQMHSLSQYKNQSRDAQSTFIINQQNNPTITKAIQNKLNDILLDQLFTQQRVSFQNFSKKRKIKRDIKGELFYQLLHMDFPLTQTRPEQFGSIFIQKKEIS